MSKLKSDCFMKKSLGWIKWKLYWQNQSPLKRREPWFCKPAIKWLKNMDISKFRILEYGGGGSTLYFSDRCESVETIEKTKIWQRIICTKLRNANHCFVEKPSGEYDLILIDSIRNRKKEFRIAKEFVKKGGIIIFDNIDRYPEARQEMVVEFKGWASDRAGLTCTGVWIK